MSKILKFPQKNAFIFPGKYMRTWSLNTKSSMADSEFCSANEDLIYEIPILSLPQIQYWASICYQHDIYPDYIKIYTAIPKMWMISPVLIGFIPYPPFNINGRYRLLGRLPDRHNFTKQNLISKIKIRHEASKSLNTMIVGTRLANYIKRPSSYMDHLNKEG